MPRKSTGRVTPRKGGPAATAKAAKSQEKWQLEQSRQVTSPWAWRGMLFMSLVAIGVGFIFLGNHDNTLGYLWFVIAVGWLGFAMMLWRKHARFMRN